MNELTGREFEELYKREYKRVFMTAYQYLKNTHDAEDISQITFMKYLQYRPRFEDERHEQNWFVRTTINNAKNYLVLSYKKRTVMVGTAYVLDALINGEIDDSCDNIFKLGNFFDLNVREAEADSDRADVLLKGIAGLPEKYMEVIHLFYYEELSVKEISEILEIKESAVTTRLTRARQKLKKYLDKNGVGDGFRTMEAVIVKKQGISGQNSREEAGL